MSTLCVVIAIAACTATWKLLEPQVAQNGTVVIAAAPVANKQGGQPLTIKVPTDLTVRQQDLLNFAYEVAKQDGYREPKYLQGILMQESRAGSLKDFRVAGLTNKPGDHYFGLGQIKLPAAKAVMSRWPVMWGFLESRNDEELQARLILDDKFNIRVASKYLLLMGVNEDPTKAVTRYNLGEAGAQSVVASDHPYTVKVKEHAAKLKSVNYASTRIQSENMIATQVALVKPDLIQRGP
jgi:hypothetical protein